MSRSHLFIRAGAVVDAASVRASPGVILIEEGRVVAAGSPQSVGAPGPDVRVVERLDAVVIPGLVNVHSHLDLTHIGPIPFSGQFVNWIDQVRRRRHVDDEAIAQSVRLGVQLSRAGGTAFIGDIAGAASPVPIRTLRESNLRGVSYLELFGSGAREMKAVEVARQVIASVEDRADGVDLGLQPHAPYSAGSGLYRFAAASGLPVATHLAETPEEIEFVREGAGPIAAMLRDFGVWDESMQGCNVHPVDLVARLLPGGRAIAAHLNYVDPQHIDEFSARNISIAYCARASAYFGHPHGGAPPHRYQEMIEGGANVALGTDSILCLDTPDRISVLDEMRFLFRRDGTDARLLLRLATTNGARALGIDPVNVTFGSGATAGVLAVRVDRPLGADPLAAMLLTAGAPEWLAEPLVDRSRSGDLSSAGGAV